MDPDRLRRLLDPATTALVTMELQRGVVGEEALLPALPAAVRQGGVLEAAGRICDAARRAGVRVVHNVIAERADGAGQAVNCKLLALAAKRRAEFGSNPTDIGRPGAALVDELRAGPADIVVARSHGLTPFTSTSLDQILRNLGVSSIVLIGVSINIGIMGAALSAVDLGYQVIVVSDAVAGVPPEYAAAALQHSISMVATLANADEVISAWEPG